MSSPLVGTMISKFNCLNRIHSTSTFVTKSSHCSMAISAQLLTNLDHNHLLHPKVSKARSRLQPGLCFRQNVHLRFAEGDLNNNV